MLLDQLLLYHGHNFSRAARFLKTKRPRDVAQYFYNWTQTDSYAVYLSKNQLFDESRAVHGTHGATRAVPVRLTDSVATVARAILDNTQVAASAIDTSTTLLQGRRRRTRTTGHHGSRRQPAVPAARRKVAHKRPASAQKTRPLKHARSLKVCPFGAEPE